MGHPQNNQRISAALLATPPVVLGPGPYHAPTRTSPTPDETWRLPGGTAWVYHGTGNDTLCRPVLLADGFNCGPSTPEFLWEGLEFGDYPFLGALLERDRDVVLVGFTDRGESILTNARAVQDAVLRAVAGCRGDGPLVVGGFGMGGVVTRYALAELESRGVDHRTELYFSYDSPHRGASVPIALQAFAHYVRELDSRFSDQMNSPAARQLLWRHVDSWDDKPGVSDERRALLAALDRVGWPARPRKIAVGNGVANGVGNGGRPGGLAFQGTGPAVVGSRLSLQAAGESQLVAELRVVTTTKHEVRTSGMPAVDSAPGGTLAGFGILADALNALPPTLGMQSSSTIRSHCFVPSISAVDVRDISPETLYIDIDGLSPQDSAFDEFLLASRNEEHTRITEELCSWIIERLP